MKQETRIVSVLIALSGSALADDGSEWAIDPIATGTDSKVWGSNAEATGDYATVWGYGAQRSASGSSFRGLIPAPGSSG
ncbi:hypothetical protein [Photobacterium sp. 1_MG-2023]|uniref:hypothetical protein n=1 Tax=Photobacterium sp. 1_MG-2023 TaxID=3062646 RepID=UPI0026E148D3|nr:hypothetical protein [Photobacterium sp. 1_MG-2023]MDO6706078.1 hypothetical protein [Photobacterium sp. 1_MG-2023]